MPAPKKFNPDPTTSRSHTTGYLNTRIKGRHAVVPSPATPGVVPDDEFEVAVEDVTVVVHGPSKYEQRSMNAHLDPAIAIDIDALEDEPEEVETVAPAPTPRIVFGEWRTESDLEGPHYHRKDSRRV